MHIGIYINIIRNIRVYKDLEGSGFPEIRDSFLESL